MINNKLPDGLAKRVATLYIVDITANGINMYSSRRPLFHRQSSPILFRNCAVAKRPHVMPLSQKTRMKRKRLWTTCQTTDFHIYGSAWTLTVVYVDPFLQRIRRSFYSWGFSAALQKYDGPLECYFLVWLVSQSWMRLSYFFGSVVRVYFLPKICRSI